jgi:tetratricopeptide (TPR) repeat protein
MAGSLESPRDCSAVLQDILEKPPSEFGRLDLGLLNLLCAGGLPGSESLNIPKCIETLDWLAAFVKAATEKGAAWFRQNPNREAEARWRIGILVTKVKRDFGASYSPTARADLDAGIDAPFNDSSEVYIHGLLQEDPKRRWGTCSSIPVLITALARRLGYPVGLAVTRCHLYARWEGGGVCFNVEASNPAGVSVLPDEHYRQYCGGLSPEEEKSGFYLRTLSPAEEFAEFLLYRLYILRDMARYDEGLLWAARALQFAPDAPHLPEYGLFFLQSTVYHRNLQRHPGRRIPRPGTPEWASLEVGDQFGIQERSLVLTIRAHHQEKIGELDGAREAYEDACRQNFHGNNEQRDLQRFLRKHGLKRRGGPLMPPKNLEQPRSLKLFCQPHQEANLLRRLADNFETNGELLNARNALKDLYMFDPSDAVLFERAREIEKRPRFQEQLKADYERWYRKQEVSRAPLRQKIRFPEKEQISCHTIQR